MMRTSNQRVQGMRSMKPKTKPIEAMSYEELQQALQRNLSVLSNTSLFASSSSQPFKSDSLATRLTQANDKIRARIKLIEENAIGSMADELQATRIADDGKGSSPNSTRRFADTRNRDPSSSKGLSGQIVSGVASQPSADHDTSSSFNSGKRRAEEMLHQRHGKVEAGGKAKVFHVSAEESLSLQKSPTKQLSSDTSYFAPPSETQSNGGSASETVDDPMNGKIRGNNVTMSYGRKEPFDELSAITQAAKLKSFISYVPWDSDDESDSDDELENAILYGDLDAIARAREKAEVLEEAETASESGSIADGMDMSGIIAVDLDKIQEKGADVLPETTQ